MLPSMGDEEYQSLYRRFRPGRFSEVLGQDHVTTALRNAVARDRVGHAYLFSGPRGTGKTSTARILASSLNCADPSEGEPCGVCDSCVAVARGSSLDVHELDAASNNGVEAMRDLVSRAALATPGRWKVYIVDEVHMLSTAASNALLKTLEEPPGRVVFVLATTDPQRVLPTIRSRTQHFEFHLLKPELLDELVARVVKDADLDLPGEILPTVVRRARGSARDALSALDQAAAGGVLDDVGEYLDALAGAIHRRDAASALTALDSAISAGREPQVLASELLERMRQDFLCTFAPDLGDPDTASRGESEDGRPGLAALVRSMEQIGRAQVDMRAAPDPRITLEVSLVRVCKPELDASPEAILERLERLERGGGTAQPTSPGSHPAGPGPGQPAKPSPRSPEPEPARKAPAASGSASKALRDRYGSPSKSAAGEGPGVPTRESLTKVWGDGLLASLPTKVRARFKVGRFVAGEPGTATFALPNEVHRSYCGELVGEVQAALSSHFGVPIELVLVVDPEGQALEGIVGGPERAGGRERAGGPGALGGPERLDVSVQDVAPGTTANGTRPNGRVTRSAPPGRVVANEPPVDAEDEILNDPSQLLGEQEVHERAAALILEHFPGAVEITASPSPSL